MIEAFTDEGDLKILKRALRLADAVEVEHTLCGMLVGTVAGVDDGHGGHLGGVARRAFLGVAHDDEVGVGADHDDGVVERFAFLDAGAAGVGEADDASTELVGGALEAQARTRGGFKEKSSHHLVGQDWLLRFFLKFLSDVEYLDVLLFAEVCNGNQIPSF